MVELRGSVALEREAFGAIARTVTGNCALWQVFCIAGSLFHSLLAATCRFLCGFFGGFWLGGDAHWLAHFTRRFNDFVALSRDLRLDVAVDDRAPAFSRQLDNAIGQLPIEEVVAKHAAEVAFLAVQIAKLLGVLAAGGDGVDF